MPQDFPPLAAPQPASTSSKPQRKPPTTPSSIKPAVPSLQTQPTKGIDNEKQKRVEEQQLSSDKQPVGPVSDAPVEPVSKSKNNKELTAPSSTSQGRSKRQQKSNEISDATASTGLSALSTESGTVETEASTKMQALDSRQRPSKLDITAAKDVSGAVDTATSSKKAADSKDPVSSSTKTTSAISQPETPATASSQASNATTAKQGQPRTLRVVPTSSSETQAKGHGPAPMTSKQPSRRESLSSINLPSTPVSERISDNISLTSASMSRANSPPPNKVGTAPVRHMSKTQQKKERQVRAKQAEEAAKAEAPPIQESVEEPVQAPIIGRKKKTKKAATRGPTADSTPSATRPSSPAAKEDTATLDQEVSLPVTPVQETKRADLPASVEKDSEAPFSPATPASVDQHSSQHQKPAVTASAIWAILRSSKHISPAAADIFRSVPGVNHRFDLDASFLESELQLPDLAPPQLSDEHLDSLERGEAVCVEQPILPNTNSSPDRRLLVVLPDRRTLRGLTKEQAKRYVQLRKEALATSELLHQAGHGPATSKPSPLLPRTASGGTRKGAQGPHLSNPFLVSETSSAAAAAAGSAAAQQGAVNSGSGAVVNPLTKLPQAFGGVLASNVSTTYQDEGAMAAAASTLTAARKGAVGIEEAEVALGASRKETEALEKKLLGLLRRNRRLVFGPNA
ncbi:MAG: hypothetical protein LQ342_007713 [Letrouitia transgressa]|nr:MAG: hypothetical protein LQ342_007713 [Letrouitia transgressa]